MLYLNDKIRVGSDSFNVYVEVYRTIVNKKTGEPREDWVNIGWYYSLEQALKGIIRKRLVEELEGNNMDIKQMLSLLEEINNEVKEYKKVIKV